MAWINQAPEWFFDRLLVITGLLLLVVGVTFLVERAAFDEHAANDHLKRNAELVSSQAIRRCLLPLGKILRDCL